MPIANPRAAPRRCFRTRRDLAAQRGLLSTSRCTRARGARAARRAPRWSSSVRSRFKLFTTRRRRDASPQFEGCLRPIPRPRCSRRSRRSRASAGSASCTPRTTRLIRYFARLNAAGRRRGAAAGDRGAAIALVGGARQERPTSACTSPTSRPAKRSARARRDPIDGRDATGETCPQYLVLDCERRRRARRRSPGSPRPCASPKTGGAVGGARPTARSTSSPATTLRSRSTRSRGRLRPRPDGPTHGRAARARAARRRGARRLPLELAVELVTSRPAALFGLAGRKGTIAVGADADVALANLDASFRPGPRHAARGRPWLRRRLRRSRTARAHRDDHRQWDGRVRGRCHRGRARRGGRHTGGMRPSSRNAAAAPSRVVRFIPEYAGPKITPSAPAR